MSPLTIAYYDSERDLAATVLPDTPWSQLEQLLTPKPASCSAGTCPGKNCQAKYGPAWSPVELSVPERLDKHVTLVTALVLDLDHLDEAGAAAVAKKIDPYHYLAHTTHSHRHGNISMRVVLELSRPVPASDWPRFLRAAVTSLAVPADPTCKNVSRLYFTPRHPQLAADYWVSANEGKCVDVDAVLGSAAADPAASAVAALTPLASRPEPLEVNNLDDVREAIAKVYRSKSRSKKPDPAKQARDKNQALALKRLLEGEAIAVPGDWVGDTDLPRGRDDTLNETMSLVAFAVPVLTPWDVVAEIARRSLGFMSAPEGPAHWTREAEDMYRRAMSRRVAQETHDEEMRAVIQTNVARQWWAVKQAAPEPEKPEPVEGQPHPDDWHRHLVASKDGWKSCGANAATILAHAPETRGSLRWNVLRKTVEVTGGIFVGVPAASLDVAVGNWLTTAWGVALSRSEVGSQILFVSRLNPYDPVRDYLDQLEWDGVERLDGWLISYCGAETKARNTSVDVTKWVRLFGSRWLTAAVARAFEPGCQADNVLILEGQQGIRKSTVFRLLGEPWFTGGKIVLGDKDARMVVARSWIIELAELTSLKRGDVEGQKQFLTEVQDTFRPPYGSAVEDFPRRCVFGGTTNPDDSGQYLTDQTGNRRYWPVYCPNVVDADRLRADRDQLWAEAVARYRRYKAGDLEARWWMEFHENAELEEVITASRVVEDPFSLVEAIKQWWDRLVKKDPVTVHDICVGCLQIEPSKVTRQDEQRVGRAMKRLGFDRRQVFFDGRPKWFYVKGATKVPLKNADGKGWTWKEHLTSLPDPKKEEN